MPSITTKYAFLGPELTIQTDVVITYNNSGYITGIEKTTGETDSSLVAIPAFFNAHVHAADIGIREQIGTDLHEVVGPGGIKHQYLGSLSSEELMQNIESSIHEARENGILGFVDFREGGLDGREPYVDLHKSPEYRAFRPFIRPNEGELDQLPEGTSIGIRDVIAYSPENMIELSRRVHNQNGQVQIHASEDANLRKEWISKTDQSDICWAIDKLQSDTIVHATLADAKDIEVIAKTDTGVVICPTSNEYFNVGKPPVKDFLAADIKLGLGSDNAMVNQVSLWKEIRLLQDWKVDSSDILHMATVGGASICNQKWGIIPGNSNFLVFDLPTQINQENIINWILNSECLLHLVDCIYPVTTQSDN